MLGVLKCHWPGGESGTPINSVFSCSEALESKGKGTACANEGKLGWEGRKAEFSNEFMISLYF